MPRVVTRHILAVLRKFDGKPAKRRLVRPRHVALDNRPRLQPKVLRALDGDGVEERRRHAGGWITDAREHRSPRIQLQTTKQPGARGAKASKNKYCLSSAQGRNSTKSGVARSHGQRHNLTPP